MGKQRSDFSSAYKNVRQARQAALDGAPRAALDRRCLVSYMPLGFSCPKIANEANRRRTAVILVSGIDSRCAPAVEDA